MKTLRICMVTCEFPPKSAGIGKCVYSLSKSLVSRGHSVTVITRGKRFTGSERNLEGIRIIEVPFIAFPPPFHLIFHGYFVNRKLKVLRNDLDIIHLHTPLVPKINISLPKLVQVHSLWIEETKYFKGANDLYSFAVRIFKKQVMQSEKTTLQQAREIVVYTEHEKKLLHNYKISLPEINKIRGAVSSEFKQLEGTTKRYDVVFTGRLNPRKGIEEIMHAAPLIAKTFPNVKFLIIGHGSSRKWMQKQAARIGLQDNFTFLGFVINKKIEGFLNESKIAIVPSRYEPFGIVTGEAMQCGLPVIGTKVSGTQCLVKDGITGYLVDVGDYHSLANKVIELLSNDKKAESMGIEGMKRLITHFSQEKITTSFEDIYRRII